MSRKPGRPRDAAKEAMWREMIRRHAQSNLSVRAFCEKHVLDEAAFFAWRRRLDASDEASGHSSARDIRPKPTARPSAFAQVMVVGAPADEEQVVEIVVADRERVRVRPGFDRGTLAAVLDVLEGRPC